MLNRYGLFEFDIEKFLREQDEAPPPGGAPPAPEGGAPPEGEAPPPAPEEDPDEKVQGIRDKAKGEDLVRFRTKHADAIYRVVQAFKQYQKAGMGGVSRSTLDPSADERYSFSTQTQNLKSKFSSAGIDAPYMAIFDQTSTGLGDDAHVRFLTSVHGGRAGGGGRFMFPSPGQAAEFVDMAGQLRPDLAFKAQRGDPRVVGYTVQQEQDKDQDKDPDKDQDQEQGQDQEKQTKKQPLDRPAPPVAPMTPPPTQI